MSQGGRRSRRLAKKPEFNYRTYNNTGEKVERSSREIPIYSSEYETSVEDDTITAISELFDRFGEMTEPANPAKLVSDGASSVENDQMMMTDLHLQIESVKQDIEDFIDENNVESYIVTSDVDECIDKMEKLRTVYRSLNNSMKKYLQTYVADDADCDQNNEYQFTIVQIKKFIHCAKQRKQQLRESEVPPP